MYLAATQMGRRILFQFAHHGARQRQRIMSKRVDIENHRTGARLFSLCYETKNIGTPDRFQSLLPERIDKTFDETCSLKYYRSIITFR